jgi:membrane-associated phospholipid phosphatase
MAGERAARPPPHSLSPRGLAIAGWTALLVAAAIFAALAWNVSGHTPLVRLDRQVTAWFAAHRSDAATAIMLAISHAHALFAVAMWSVVFAAVLARLREWYWMLTLALAVAGGMLLNLLLKLAYARVRPDLADPLVTLTSYSFPSGHTASAAVFHGVLAAFLVSRLRDLRARVACVVVAAGAVALVALSRVYLGAHHLSDVVAAGCSSTVWLVLCLSGVHGLVRRKMDAR